MVSIKTARELALAFDEVVEEPHFEKSSFRINKKIYTTLNEKDKRMTVRLSPLDQDVFCTFDKEVIHAVPNAWGKQGWTVIHLGKTDLPFVQDILQASYCNVAPKKLAAIYH